MKGIFKIIIVILFIAPTSFSTAQKAQDFKPKEVYKSDNLVITQVSMNAFVHTSFLQTDDFGNVPCNGMVVRNEGEVIIFNTPTSDKNSAELMTWITENLTCKITAIIPTHFHKDCLGGLKAFNDKGVLSYANSKTIVLAKENNYEVPNMSFNDSLILKVGKEVVIAKFLGEGHTKDNIVGYFPSEKVLFGGCLIKELNATKGYLGDANVNAWSSTVETVKKEYPQVKIVIPGHGAFGNQKLLDYTIRLFK